MPSELVQFRLNPNDPNYPDDGKALAILARWRRKGHSDRKILTGALLHLDGEKVPTPTRDDTIKRLLTLANMLEGMIEEIKSMDRSAAVYVEGDNAGQPVNFGIMDTILNGLKKRIVAEDEDDE